MRLLKPVWVSHGSLSKDQAVGRPIYSLDIHPDGTRLATGGLVDTCGVVILWNMIPIRDPSLESDNNISRKLFQMDSHQACVNCVRWSPCGRWLASAGMDKVIMLWTKSATGSRSSTVFGVKEQTKFTEHWRCATTLRGHSGDIIDLSWSLDGNRLASASVDNSVIVWCRQKLSHTSGHLQMNNSFSIQATLKGHRGFVKGVAWDPIGRYLASQSDDLNLKIWRTADWQEEVSINKPFSETSGQSQVMRLSWSLDGSTVASPHAVNNGFPTAKLIDRTDWNPTLDLVGHRKHVICARYNPNILRMGNENPGSVCIALGSKDRSVSVWSTAGRRARVVVHDLFTNSVCDLSWSADGCELMACSLDGTVCFMSFTHNELGNPWSVKEVLQLHHKLYGQSLLDKVNFLSDNNDLNGSCKFDPLIHKSHNALNQSDIVLETPDALALQQTRAELYQRLDAHKDGDQRLLPTKSLQRGPSKQIESRGKDGRRRITPKFLGHLDSPEEDTNSNPHFTSPQKNKIEHKSSSESDVSTSTVINTTTTTTTSTVSSPVKTLAATVTTMSPSACGLACAPSFTESTTTTTTTDFVLNVTTSTVTATTTVSTTATPITHTNNANSLVTNVTVTSSRSNVLSTDTGAQMKSNQSVQQITSLSGTTSHDNPQTKQMNLGNSVNPDVDFISNSKHLNSGVTINEMSMNADQQVRSSLNHEQQVPTTPITSQSSQKLTQESPIPGDAINQLKRPIFSKTDTVTGSQDDSSKLVCNMNRQRKRRCVRLFNDDERPLRQHTEKPNGPSRKAVISPDTSPNKSKLELDDTNSMCKKQSHNQSHPASWICAPDQLSNVPKLQFVCSHLVDGPIMVQLLNSITPGNNNDDELEKRSTQSISRIIATRGDKRCWELIIPDHLTAYAYTDHVIVIGDEKGHVHFLHSTGGRICPPLLLDSVHTLILTACDTANNSSQLINSTNNSVSMCRLHAVVSGNERPVFPVADGTGDHYKFTPNTNHTYPFIYRVAALCRSGRLVMWNLDLTATQFGSVYTVLGACVFPKLLTETNIQDILSSGSSKLASICFGPDANPIVHLQNGSTCLYHVGSRNWIELFNASELVRCQIAATSIRGCPNGPLSSCQLLAKTVSSGQKSIIQMNNSNASKLPSGLSTGKQILYQNFFESQTQIAKEFGSAAEYRFWLTRWFRQLVEDNEEERIRQTFQDLIGPVPRTAHTTWQSEVKGIPKRDLVKDLLSLFALNLHLQRLYIELKDMFNESQLVS